VLLVFDEWAAPWEAPESQQLTGKTDAESQQAGGALSI